MRGGRYWNVGLSDTSRLAATDRQLWALHLLSGRKEDFRGKGLTRGEASEKIRELTEQQEDSKRQLDSGGVQDAMFRAFHKKAVRAANAAGDKWMEEHPEALFAIHDPAAGTDVGVHGALGVAYVAWPPRKTPFGAWLERNFFDGQTVRVNIPHDYADRLERDLLIACEGAALRTLQESGVSGLKLMVRDDPASLA
jgi:hypothetical protein